MIISQMLDNGIDVGCDEVSKNLHCLRQSRILSADGTQSCINYFNCLCQDRILLADGTQSLVRGRNDLIDLAETLCLFTGRTGSLTTVIRLIYQNLNSCAQIRHIRSNQLIVRT